MAIGKSKLGKGGPKPVKKMRGGGMAKKMRGGGMAKKMRGGGMVKKVRDGGGFYGRVNLGAGSPTRYSGMSGRLGLTIPIGPPNVDKPSPYVELSVDRRQGLGTDKGVPSVSLGADYKYNLKK